MGWKGTLRSVQAASRRVERDARRRQRQLEQQQLQLAKMQELERAQYEVAVFENHIAVITSVHKECGELVNWPKLASLAPLGEPMRTSESEERARAASERYKPSMVDKLMGQVNLKRAELARGVERAVEQDESNYQKQLADYRQELHDWEMNRKIAEGVLAGDVNAFIEAIRQLSPLAELGELGSSISFNIDDSDATIIEVTLRVNEESVIPRQSKSLLKTGKLSVKDIPKTQFWTLYQDYVCGAALRVARELFALLPTEMVIVTALGQVLNTQTGHMDEQPILSVAFPRGTVERLNFDLLDPSDSMENFVHNMKFLKTKGFAPVGRLNVADFRHSNVSAESKEIRNERQK
jgi:hypothetical protein